MDLLERLMYKLTSGRFIFTIVTALVFAYLSMKGILKEDRTMEVILIVIYAYFARSKVDVNGNIDDSVGNVPNKVNTTTTTTTLKP
jgi:hypothetical protein